MRRITGIGLAFLLVVMAPAGCGDDEGATTTTAPAATTLPPPTTTTTTPPTTTTTTPPTTTTTTLPWEVHSVAATTRCVIGQGPGEDLNVRSGPSTDYPVVETLPDDGAAPATGLAAYDDSEREWLQLDLGGTQGWSAGWLLTANECVQSAPTGHCVIDTDCDDRLNVREGPSGTAARLGSLAHDAVDVAGTGWSTTDDSDRTWIQIEWQGGVAWAAGWFLTEEPCGPWAGTCACPLPDGWYDALVDSVDAVGRFLEFDAVDDWVWVGPADTEGYWVNTDFTVVRLPVADGTMVSSCPDTADPTFCDPEDFVDHTLADLAGWVAAGTEVGQNQRWMAEIPGHTGNHWLIRVEGCSVVVIDGIWWP